MKEDKTLKEMKGQLTRDNYLLWRSNALTHMDASHRKIANHLRRVENSSIDDIKNGKLRLSPEKDAQLWPLFYCTWLPDKTSGLSHFTRIREGVVTWKLIYDGVTGDKSNVAVKYRRWLSMQYGRRTKNTEEAKNIFDEMEAHSERMNLVNGGKGFLKEELDTVAMSVIPIEQFVTMMFTKQGKT